MGSPSQERKALVGKADVEREAAFHEQPLAYIHVINAVGDKGI
jgi:hypothetical protein